MCFHNNGDRYHGFHHKSDTEQQNTNANVKSPYGTVTALLRLVGTWVSL